MPRISKAEIQAWLEKWPIGSQGDFGGRIKERVTVKEILNNHGFPCLLLLATTGHTYYCLYGNRKQLKEIQQ